MKFSEVKVGQKVKFNGVIIRDEIAGEFENSWYEGSSSMNREYDENKNNELVVECVDRCGISFEGLDYHYPASSIDLVTKEEPKPVPHVHAEIIKAWADGYTIQCRQINGAWCDVESPNFNPENEYRVKPKEPVVTYSYKGVSDSGWINPSEYKSMIDVCVYHDRTKGNVSKIIKKTFHDEKLVNLEII